MIILRYTKEEVDVMEMFSSFFKAIDLNVYSVIFIVLVALVLRKDFDKKNVLTKCLNLITILISVQLLSEVLVEWLNKFCIVDRDKIIFVINTYLYVSGPIISALMVYLLYAYVDYAENIVNLKKFLTLPILVSILLAFCNLFEPILFRIGKNGVPVFGALYYVDMLIAILYMAVAFYSIIKYKKLLNNYEKYIFVSFNIAPIIGAALQMVFPGTFLVWGFTTLTVATMYIFLQKKITQQDSLTKLWTRNTLDIYLENKIDTGLKPFSVIYMDLDEFKPINDIYGHPEGDKALKKFAYNLKTVLDGNAKIARYGGDEFVALYYNIQNVNLDEEIKKLKEAIQKENNSKKNKWKLKFSYSYASYDEKKYGSPGQFFRYLDTKMYEQKDSKKKKEAKKC